MAILESLLLALDRKRPRPAPSNVPNLYLEGNFAPLGFESDSPDLTVTAGAIRR